MKSSLCFDCVNRKTITVYSSNGLTYMDYVCTINNMRIKALSDCPEGYSMEEYEELLEKGEFYDMIRYGCEFSHEMCK